MRNIGVDRYLVTGEVVIHEDAVALVDRAAGLLWTGDSFYEGGLAIGNSPGMARTGVT